MTGTPRELPSRHRLLGRRRCSTCGKACFDSPREARNFIRSQNAQQPDSAGHIVRRKYRCPGGEWHVTTKEGLRLPELPVVGDGRDHLVVLDAVLGAIADQGPGLVFPDHQAVARRLGLTKASTKHLVSWLRQNGWLRDDPPNQHHLTAIPPQRDEAT